MFKEKFIANPPSYLNKNIADAMNVFPELWANSHVRNTLLENVTTDFLSNLNYKKLKSLNEKGKLSTAIYSEILQRATDFNDTYTTAKLINDGIVDPLDVDIILSVNKNLVNTLSANNLEKLI